MPIETGAAGAAGVGGGGGGGDASAANQVLGLTALDQIYDALALAGTEATSADILVAVTGLGDGATLSDLASALSSDAVTQASILSALQSQGIDIAATKSAVDLLVPDLDAVRVATEATNAKLSQLASGYVTVRLSDSSSFLPLPAALGAGGGLKIDGSGTALPVSGSVTADTELATPAVLADGTANPTVTSLGAFLQGYNGTTWDRVLTQNGRLVVSGNVANNASAALPVTTGGVDTNGRSWPFVGAQVGNAIHLYTRATNSVGNELATELTQTNGNARVKIEGSSPTADATTGVYTRFPTIGTASTAFASGVAQMKTLAGRVRTIEIFYTGATNSGLYVQLHAVNGTPTNATLVNSWPINAKSPRLTIQSDHDLPCPAGIALAFSSTETTYTAAAAETGSAIAWGA